MEHMLAEVLSFVVVWALPAVEGPTKSIDPANA